METLSIDNELLTWTEICTKYPDMRVMIGIPEGEVSLPKNTRKGNVFGKDTNRVSVGWR